MKNFDLIGGCFEGLVDSDLRLKGVTIELRENAQPNSNNSKESYHILFGDEDSLIIDDTLAVYTDACKLHLTDLTSDLLKMNFFEQFSKLSEVEKVIIDALVQIIRQVQQLQR